MEMAFTETGKLRKKVRFVRGGCGDVDCVWAGIKVDSLRGKE